MRTDLYSSKLLARIVLADSAAIVALTAMRLTPYIESSFTHDIEISLSRQTVNVMSQSPTGSEYPAIPKSGMTTGAKIALGVILGSCIVMGGCFACATFIFDRSIKNLNLNASSTAKPSESPSGSSSRLPDSKLEQGRQIMERYTAWRDLLKAKETLSEIPAGAPEYTEAKRLLDQLEPRIRKAEAVEAPQLRERLAESYRKTIATSNSHLNFITKKITKVKEGYAIWAVHDFFSQFTLSAGGDAQVVTTWIIANYDELQQAQIKQVGFWGSGPFGSRCWLPVS